MEKEQNEMSHSHGSLEQKCTEACENFNNFHVPIKKVSSAWGDEKKTEVPEKK